MGGRERVIQSEKDKVDEKPYTCLIDFSNDCHLIKMDGINFF